MRLGMGLGLGNLLSGQPLTGFPNDFSFNFDGSNDYLDCGTSLGNSLGDNYSGDLSVSMWFKASATNVEEGLFTIGNFNGAYGEIDIAYSANKIYFSLNGNGWNGYINNTSTDWQHIAVVYKAGSESDTKIYINGSHVSFVATSGTFPSSANMDFNGLKNIIGAYYNTSYTFTGLIDEIGVWDVALSNSDVTSVYNNGKIVDLSKSASYGTDRTANLKLWLRAGDKALPESDASIARQDFYTDFDGSDDYVSVADNDDLSFGDGSSDTPFSISVWANLPTVASTNFIGKGHYGSNYEYNFHIGSDKKFYWLLFDQSATAYIGRIYNTALDAYENEWTHFCGTYDGSGANSGVKLYINGVQVDDTNGGVGSYTAMENLGAEVRIMRNNTNYSDGSITNLAVYKTKLDAQTISQMAKSRFTPMRDNRFSVVDFDGTNDFIDTGTGLPDVTSGAFTISGWFNFDSVSATHWLWGRGTGSGSGYAIKFDTTPRLIAQSKTASSYQYYASNYTFSVGEWYHIVFVHSGTGTTPKIYINGALNAGSGAWNSDIVSQSSLSFKIGSNEGTSNEFNGQIANVAWYSEAKDAKFVYAQYQKGITHNPSADTALEGLWLMGDDTSKAFPTIADSSSNSNDGTMTSMTSDDIQQQMVAGYDLGAFESSSEELSAELIGDPSFDDASYYTIFLGTGTVDINTTNTGKLTAINAENKQIIRSNITENGKLYKVTITLDSYTDGSIIGVNNSTGLTFGTLGVGTFTGYFVASGTSFNLRVSGYADFTATDISVKEVLQSADLSDTYPAIIDVNEPVLGADIYGRTNSSLFTAGSGAGQWSGGTVTSSSVAGGATLNGADPTLSTSVIYRVQFTCTVTSGSFDIRVGSTSTGTNSTGFISSSGTYGFNIIAGGSNHDVAIIESSWSGSITSFSIKQIQGSVGTMTNFDNANSGDIMYGSVLPDQSFLATGVNSAYNFISLDGTNDYIKNESFTGHQQDTGTISIWVKFGDISGYQYIAGVGGNASAGTNRVITLLDENLRFSGYSADFDTGADVVADNWYHIVLIWNGTSVIFYLDGTAYTNTVSNLVTPTGTNFVVGAYPAGFGGKAHADFGTVAHWNKVLTSTEVNAIKDLGRHGNLLDSYSDNLKLCYSMSGLDAKTGFFDTATTIYDRSGNSNHGTTVSIASADLKSSPNAEPNGYAKGDTNRSTTTP